jgi:lysozyme
MHVKRVIGERRALRITFKIKEYPMAHPANANLQISPAGLALIKKWEGWYPKAYKDPVGVWTIGYGTIGPEARPGRTITKATGEKLLQAELEKDQETVKRLVDVPLNQYQFDALVSFVYNLGSGNFSRSTLRKLLNRGNYIGAAGQFIRWNKARDRATNKYITLNGLTNRRNDEAALFLRDPLDDIPAKDLDMERQAPLADPHSFDGNVQPDAPQKNSNPLMEVVLHTDSFKALLLSLTGVGIALKEAFEPFQDNPIMLFALAVIGAGVFANLYVKYRDTSEGR